MPLKIAIIGASGSGKTTLRWAMKKVLTNDNISLSYDDFESLPLFPATISVEFETVEYKNTKLTLWDTVGQERYAPLTRSFTRGAAVILLVYDVSVPRSFDILVNHWQPIARAAIDQALVHDQPPPLVFLIANKLDRLTGPLPELKIEEAYARSRGMQGVALISCSDLQSVREFVFNDMLKQLMPLRKLYNQKRKEDTVDVKRDTRLLIRREDKKDQVQKCRVC